MTPGTLWLVSPSYFDAEAYRRLQERVLATLDAQPRPVAERVRFVVADDTGGLDLELAALARERDDTILVTPPFNLGHQRALVFALRNLSQRMRGGDLVVTLDADGEDRPEDLPRLLAPLLDSAEHGREIVVAQRTQRRETLPFKGLYLVFLTIFRGLTGTTMRSGNFAAYSGRTGRTILRHPYFDLCYSSTLVALDLPVKYIPCPRGERYAGRSRMGYGPLVMHGFRMLTPFTDRIAVRSLIAFSGAFALSLALALAAIAIPAVSDEAIPGWAAAGAMAMMVVSLLSVANALILFAVFSQSRGISLSNLEDDAHGNP